MKKASFPRRFSSIQQIRYWAARLIKEGGLDGRRVTRDLLWRVGSALVRDGRAKTLREGKEIARSLVNRAEKYHVERLAVKTPPQRQAVAA